MIFSLACGPQAILGYLIWHRFSNNAWPYQFYQEAFNEVKGGLNREVAINAGGPNTN